MTSIFHAGQSLTIGMSLDDVISRIASSEVVEGVILMGTTGTSSMAPNSDYDLFLVFSDDNIPLRMVTTWIEDRLAEVYCSTITTIERIISHPDPWADLSEEGVVLTWLRDGRIAHDRSGMMARGQDAAANAPIPVMPGEAAIYEAWRKIGYNVAHLRRYLAFDDPQSQLAVDLRLLYSLDEVKGHYFTVRRLPWRGEKPAIRYWTAHDPEFSDRLREYFGETDRTKRVELYVELARLALAPVGGLWESGSTVSAIGPPFGSPDKSPVTARRDTSLRAWNRLIGVGST